MPKTHRYWATTYDHTQRYGCPKTSHGRPIMGDHLSNVGVHENTWQSIMAAQSLHMVVHEALGGCPEQHVADHNAQDGCPRLGYVADHVSVVWPPKSFTWLPRMDERWTSVAAQSEVALAERGSPRLGVSGSEWAANLGGWWWCMAAQNPHVAAQNFVGVVWTLVVSHIVGVRGLAWLPKL